MTRPGGIVILGAFVADATYRAERLPRMGETLLGQGFHLGPGGKGSNQAVGAGRLGARVALITRLGDDDFARLGRDTWAGAGVEPVVTVDADSHTGSAFIFIETASGDNAIIISPGAAARLGPADLDAAAARIGGAAIFMTQLEQPLGAAYRGLQIARNAGVMTILNPAPAAPLDDALLALCDYVTPNETEAEALTGIAVTDEAGAAAACAALIGRGVGRPVITLGERGAWLHDFGLVPAVSAGPVVETTGAGDAFNAGFATALAEGASPERSVAFGCAVAGLSVTRPGAAASMPERAEVDRLMSRR